MSAENRVTTPPSAAVPESWDIFYRDAPLNLARVIDTAVWQRRFLDLLMRETREGDRCLETGIGTGAMSVYLAAHGRRTTGLDLEADLLQRLHGPLTEGLPIEVLQGDLFAIPLPENSMDVVFSQGVLEHFDAPRFAEAITEALRVAPRVVVSLPSMGVRHPLFGNEQLRPAREWMRLGAQFRLLEYRAYDPGPRILKAFEGVAWWGGGETMRRRLAPAFDRAMQQLILVFARS